MLEILLLVAFLVLPLIQQYLSRQQEASQPPAPRPARRASVPVSSADGPTAVPRHAEMPEVTSPAAAGAPVLAAKPAVVVRRRGRGGPKGWRLTESDARRAVVLTAVFGPCRALRPYEG
ncbi:MAG: hypothetical protein ABL971_00485 [Vicinamibacterales bacterium]